VDKVTIEKLPNTKDINGAKWWTGDNGEFVQISYKETIRHLAFFELKKGYFRGSHVHKLKEETFYVIKGRIKAIFQDMETLEKEERELVKADKIRIKTNCGHILYGLEDSTVVEYSPLDYDKTDAYTVVFENVTGIPPVSEV
jgi:dTDP-4-dehydrorhamnose 3,5-epimerase-like enzyme